jgi:hypothetical protein
MICAPQYVSSLLKGVKKVPSIVVVSTVLTTVFLYRSTSEFGTKYPRRHRTGYVGPELRAVDWANHAERFFGRVGQSLQRLRSLVHEAGQTFYNCVYKL